MRSQIAIVSAILEPFNIITIIPAREICSHLSLLSFSSLETLEFIPRSGSHLRLCLLGAAVDPGPHVQVDRHVGVRCLERNPLLLMLFLKPAVLLVRCAHCIFKAKSCVSGNCLLRSFSINSVRVFFFPICNSKDSYIDSAGAGF